MSHRDDDTRLFECDDCGALSVGSGGISCCGSAMAQIDSAGDAGSGRDPADDRDSAAAEPIPEPALDDLLRVVFGMSPAELDVCLCVMEGGTLTVAELTDRVDYDRSVVARHLNHLASLGVVKKRRQILDRGGDVYAYSPEPPEAVRRRFHEVFLSWAATATDKIDELSREKVEGIADADAGSATQWTVFREP
ncbi:MarR family transcriptional regulator [Halobaculum gomorrense]|uniref:Predicted transcriptional regulator n=1 Tax=Halobaculum gomorrense TaxID=43928 RepID=A0A1M5JI59_9EURY|nr:MarR family transcriptional regulator [Halobaculum gomorrense]SHG40232.1 Predicted transcriptional regulator [Halobaculum gomorrense]